MDTRGTIGDPRLAVLYNYWLRKKGRRPMPAFADIVLSELPASVQPNTMILEVVREEARTRFRYARVGAVFWRASGRDPAGQFVDEILPETAGYRHYVVGIYEEMARLARPMYTENLFILLHGQADPMVTKRVSLPLSSDGITVDMVLAGHVFDYGTLSGDHAFSLVSGLRESARVVLGAVPESIAAAS